MFFRRSIWCVNLFPTRADSHPISQNGSLKQEENDPYPENASHSHLGSNGHRVEEDDHRHRADY